MRSRKHTPSGGLGASWRFLRSVGDGRRRWSVAAAASPTTATRSPATLQAVAAINEQRWPDAIRLLRTHVLQFDRDADGFNWLGYAYRKTGKLDPAFKAYKRALEPRSATQEARTSTSARPT